MNKLLLACLPPLLLLLPTSTAAQQYQFGYLSYRAALEQMPEYTTAKESLQTLQQKYDDEAEYNDSNFRRMFADFLAGQKTFPQEIMLKRQKELQTAMEEGIAFRDQAAQQLKQAEEQLLAPLKEKLAAALSDIGTAYGFIFIVNTDGNDFPFIHSLAGKDVQQDVADRLNGKQISISQPSATSGQTEAPAQTPSSRQPSGDEQPAILPSEDAQSSETNHQL